MPIDRGEVVGLNGTRRRATAGTSGTNHRQWHLAARVPGTEGYAHVVATDEHDDEGGLISDEFTNPHKRQAMHEKRMRKMDGVLPLAGGAAALRTGGRRRDAYRLGLDRGRHSRGDRAARRRQGIPPTTCKSNGSCRCTPTRSRSISARQKLIIVENNYSGQFARYLRSETSFVADGHIRKYDGEPFMPHHIVDGVKAILAGETTTVRAGARDHGLRRAHDVPMADSDASMQRPRVNSRCAAPDNQGHEGSCRSGLVPRLRRLRRAELAEAGDRRARTLSA